MIINGENQLLGRIGSVVAKKALEGEEIVILNCDKVMVSGNRDSILNSNKAKLHFGKPRWGPFIPRQPFRFVKRGIRNMLPYKNPRGVEAFARIKCYSKIPKEFQGKEFDKIPNSSIDKLKLNRYVSVKEITDTIGGKK